MKVGIVTLSFNQGRFLERAIESVTIGSGHCIDYVLVDPGSADESTEVIAKHKSRFSKVIRERDSGPADGLNHGFDVVEGEVLGYLNADDEYVPGALDYVVEFFSANPNIDVLTGAAEIIDEVGKARLRRAVSTPVSLDRVMSDAVHIVQQATFFRRSAFTRTAGFNAANSTCWDFELAIDMLACGARFVAVPEVLGRFRFHQNSISVSGRLASHYASDKERIRARLRSLGIRNPSPIARAMNRFLYRFSPIRQVRQLLVR